MQIFPSLSTHSGSTASPGFALDAPLYTNGNGNFQDIFGAFLRDRQPEASFQPPLQDPARLDLTRDNDRDIPAPPTSVHGDPPLTSRELDTPVSREDFADLREKLEDLGLDAETLDQVEEMFDSDEPVTWRQILEVLREPLEELAGIKLTPEQEKDLISLLEKIGFTPDDALAMLGDILDNKLDAVFERINELLSGLTGDETFSFTPSEIQALLHALGLMGRDNASGNKDLALGKFFGLSEESFGNVDPKSVEAMRAIAEAMKKAGMEMTPELRSVVHKALGDNADVMQRVTDAAAKGELKLTPETLAAFQSALKQGGGGSPSNLEQIIQQATEKELSPEELKKILAMIKEASEGTEQDTSKLLAAIQKAMASAENRDLRMQAADNGPNAQRMSMTEAANALRPTASEGEAKNNANQGTPWQNPNAQSGAGQSAQAWESFWNKVSVQSSGEASGSLLKDTGPDPRSILGQTTAANATEAAARRILADAPAPHRAVLNQVHSGLLQNLGQGRQQLTLHLHPAELGSLTVNLKVVGNEVQAVLRAENQEARQIIAENMPLLRQSLEAQGLRVSRLEVSTQVQDQGQNQFTQLWQGSDGQKFQEQRANTQWSALGRGLLRNSGTTGTDTSEQASTLHNPSREGGINLIA